MKRIHSGQCQSPIRQQTHLHLPCVWLDKSRNEHCMVEASVLLHRWSSIKTAHAQ